MRGIKLSEYSLENNNKLRSSSGPGHQIFILGITSSNLVRSTKGSVAERSIAPVLKTGGPSGSLSSNLSASANKINRDGCRSGRTGLPAKQLVINLIQRFESSPIRKGSQAKIGKYPWNSEAFTNRIRLATSEPNRARGEIGKHLTVRMLRRESCWFESSRAHII